MTGSRGRIVEERSLGELFGELSQDVGMLVRQEAQLAKMEMQQKLLHRHDGSRSAGVRRRGRVDRRASPYQRADSPSDRSLSAFGRGLPRSWSAGYSALVGWVMLQRGLKNLKRRTRLRDGPWRP